MTKPEPGQKISKIYAWIGTGPDGGEGVLVAIGDGKRFPMLGADRARVESWRSAAEEVSRIMGVPVRLKVFGDGVVIDEIERPA